MSVDAFRRLAAGAAAIGALMAAAPAGADAAVTQVYVNDAGRLVAQAQDGVANAVTVAFSAPTNQVVLSDTAGIRATRPDGGDEPACHSFGDTTVACDVAALVVQAEPPPIAVLTADLDDSVTADPSLPAVLPIAVALGGGHDIGIGGPGNDFLYGGGGRDRLKGGAGDDVLAGENGDDSLRGQTDNDLVAGNGGGDTQLGGAGRDWIWTADDERDPVVNCGADLDQPAIIDRGLDAKPISC